MFAPLLPPQLPTFDDLPPNMTHVLQGIGTLRATAHAKYMEMQQRNLRREQAPYLTHEGAPVPKKSRHMPRCSTMGFQQNLQAASTGYALGGGGDGCEQW